ncbi:glycosyltransferase family 4 protein [Paenibacillus crassostreae]|uniref:Group 1 glycosyl transferase n=1 Tax=Paenibacillus crassostreae TaxID=1763538 RepID=A0A167GCK9_9BACL|nr:glycosyltransferase family 4 protein [Paenibacillus crassostreae]AOZ92676.1 group 1 glycosyl transferase [Paenibacillus crassostreae]OAB77446.1 group 1 glycosyl transferase [Paenibacillus crassostreae]
MKVLSTGMGWIDIQHGGLNRYFADYTNAMKEHGHSELGLIVAPKGVDLPSDRNIQNATHEVEVNHFIPRMRSVQQHAKEAISSFQPDVFNPHFAFYTTMVTRSQIPAHIPIVTHFHGPWAMESRVEEKTNAGAIKETKFWIKKQVEQMTYRRSDSFIVLSEYFRDVLTDTYGVDERKIHIIPGAVDHHRFQPHHNREELRTQLGIFSDQPLLFCIRRLVRRMGIDRLIHAMVDVVQTHPNVQLFIGGDGPMRAEYEELIGHLGLSSNVKLLGRISNEELVQYYQAADLSLVPTLTLEGFGLITVESLACGTPVLGTPYGGTKEILHQISDDLMFKDGTSESISKKIIDVLNKDSYLPSREECREHVLSQYTWGRVAEAVTEVFTEEISKRKGFRR